MKAWLSLLQTKCRTITCAICVRKSKHRMFLIVPASIAVLHTLHRKVAAATLIRIAVSSPTPDCHPACPESQRRERGVCKGVCFRSCPRARHSEACYWAEESLLAVVAPARPEESRRASCRHFAVGYVAAAPGTPAGCSISFAPLPPNSLKGETRYPRFEELHRRHRAGF
jgi:hypothetical protein